VPIDRAATLRQAEKLLRQGKLDQAIAEYLRLVEDQPRDWNTANLLGDLYVRSGQLDRAIEQFARIAESLRNEGFVPKASALYKKILKLKADDDHALMQAGELSAQQGLLADARAFFATAAAGRRHRGDAAGALAVVVRLGTLDKGDVEARLAGARARLELDDLPGGLHEFTELATALVEQGRDAEALAPLQEVVRLDPGNANAAKELARILIGQGRASEAAAYLTPDAVGTDDNLMLVAAEMRLRNGETEAGIEVVGTLLARDASASTALMELALSLAGDLPEAAYLVVNRLVGACVERGAWTDAADMLARFVERAPKHVTALTQLVDVCVEGGLDDRIVDAQALLADAYLSAGAAAQARCVAEDLVTRQPWERAHIARLRSVLEAEGESDPDRAVAEWMASATAFGIDDGTLARATGAHAQAADVAAPVPAADFTPQPPPATSAPAVEPPHVPGRGDASPPESAPQTEAALGATSRNPHAIDMGLVFGRASAPPASAGVSVEEDLSAVLDEIRPPSSPAQAGSRPADVETVFEQLRDHAAHLPGDESAQMAYVRGAAMFEAGDLEPAIEQLRVAARSPRRRFAAASLLARIYQQQKRTGDAIEWLGHAVDAPGLSRAERFDALFRLADLLEASGEPESALAVYLELQADAGDFRDVSARITRLSQTSGG
jgi:tetratricopeptide (TPR) repeat protein